MNYRVYNDFKNRLLRGVVPSSFDCRAVLLNSKYEDLGDNVLYCRTVDDIAGMSANALGVSMNYVTSAYEYTGTTVATADIYDTTYYRTDDLAAADAITDLKIVTSANSGYYYPIYHRGSGRLDRFSDYLKKYGYFYLVTRADEFYTLVDHCKNTDIETFAVVLGDDIEHVSVTGSCFGNSRKHPFRGIFDGNGFALCVSDMLINARSNGIFGYIAEDATIRNLIVSADSNALDKSNAKISVYNTQQITLNTIKQGLGDVKFGVLAGENNGTLENVYVNAKLDFLSEFTPGTYFVQNKTEDAMSLVGEAWKAAKVSTFDNATALSSYTNLCYPTSLCINSEANLVPYVGYFNEGVFNQSAISLDQSISTPFYGVDTYTTYKYKNDSREPSNKVYFGDIFSIYKQKTKADEHDEDEEYINKNVDDLFAVGQPSSILSYRLGPNSRQAYLLGGVVGLNNGDVTKCVSDVEMTFEQNIVALVGGFAGRGARGNINNIATHAKFFGTSSMYTNTRMVSNNNDIAVTATSRYNMQTVQPSAYYTEEEVNAALNPSTVTIYKRPASEDVDVLFTSGNIISAMMIPPNPTSYLSGYQNIYLNGELRLLGSAYEVFDDEVDDPAISIVSKDLQRLYTFRLTQPIKWGPSAGNGQAFIGTRTLVAIPSAVSGEFGTTARSFQEDRIKITASNFNTTVLYGIMPAGSNQIELITNSARYYMASALNDTEIKIINSAVNIPALALNINYEGCFYYDTWNYYNATGSYTQQLSGISLNAIYNMQNSALLVSMKEADDLQITYSPIYNMGGMFGEYVYANDQSIEDAWTVAEGSGFKASADAPTHGYNKLNTICHFTSNLIIDSSNKSNSDWDTSSFLASANSRVKNNMHVHICAITGDDRINPPKISAVSASDDCLSAITPMYRLDIYNQIAPSVITTHYGDNDHNARECSPPNMGITWMDQLFYRYGLNMGDNLDFVTGDEEEDKRENMQKLSPANSGWYFNYPAQGQLFNATAYKNTHAVSASRNDSIYDANLWWHATVLTSTYDILSGNVNPYNMHGDLHVTNQLYYYPNHYPIYRGRASIDLVTTKPHNKFTYEPDAYMKVHYNFDCRPISNIAYHSESLLTALNAMHSNAYNPIYIYTYSAEKRANGKLPQPSATMMFKNQSFTGADTNTLIENAYWLSSNSYEDIYMKNGYAKTNIQSGTIPLYLPAGGIDTTLSSCECSSFGISATNYALGKVLELAFDTEYSAANPYIELMPNNPKNHGFAVENNQLYITEPKTVGNVLLEPRVYLHYMSANADFTEYRPASSMIDFIIPMSATTLDRAATLHESAYIHLTNSAVTQNNVLTANSLVFGFALNDVDITKLLDQATYSKVYCSVIDTNDINSILLIDDQHRPIMDIQLDETEIHSAGYYQRFEPDRISQYMPYSLTAGLAINIETGN